MITNQGRHTGAAPRNVYYHDYLFLNGYELRIAGTNPIALASSADGGSIAQFELTNEMLQLDGNTQVAQQTSEYIRNRFYASSALICRSENVFRHGARHPVHVRVGDDEVV